MNQKEYILISDVDDTVMGNSEALKRLADFFQGSGSQVGIVYASGRFADSIRADVLNRGLPEPVAIIGGVGAEMEVYKTKQSVTAWENKLEDHWSFDGIREVLLNEEGLVLQPEECQSRFKLSYYLYDAAAERLAELKNRITRAGYQVSMIYSSNRDLDFLPVAADKGKAAAFLAGYLGYDSEHVFVSGNSGNDLSLFGYGFKGIVVGNADEQLRLGVQKPVYLAKNGYADGVREGLLYWLSNRVQ